MIFLYSLEICRDGHSYSMKILLTNDDGFHAAGIIELAKSLQKDHDVFMVAPRTEQSGISQAITFLRPMFPVALDSETGIEGFSLDGTPTDCVKLGLEHLCPFKPDLIVSGINGGYNVGVNCCYSGTVGGALTATQFGFPAIAFSLEFGKQMNYAKAADLAAPLVQQLWVDPWPQQVALNINFPSESLSGNAEIHFVPQETNPLGYKYDEGRDPKGRLFYWANNKPAPEPSPHPTDVSVVNAGNISVTTLSFNLNHADSLSVFREKMTSSTAT